MDLNDYFFPVSLEKPSDNRLGDPNLFCKNIYINTPNTQIEKIDEFKIAIIGVPEGRLSTNENCSKAPDSIRNKLYQLNRVDSKTSIIDLGNFRSSGSINDTIFGLRDVLGILLKKNITPILFGGSKNIVISAYLAYEEMKENLQIVTFENNFEFGKTADPENSYFLDKILAKENHKLFNYSLLGYQSCFIDRKDLNKIENLYFQAIRLGLIRNNFKTIEPIIRDADIVNFSLDAIKQSDAPAHHKPTPNGFSAEEACQVARYAGLSNKKLVFGLFDLFPEYDINDQSAHLYAQMVWYFLEAFNQRKNEDFLAHPNEFKKYIVSSEDPGKEIIFYKNIRSHRWWMEIPCIKDKDTKSIIAACSEEDYNCACNHEIPSRWLKIYQKMN